jgi:hypothetical protein
MNETQQKTLDDASPRGMVRKWLSEISIAEKLEADWRKEAGDIYDLYEAEKQQSDGYNILWSNTEVLRPALYNSTPTPDVRRRFRDEDPLGKAVSQILQRALAYSLEAHGFDDEMKKAVLDCLLVGRGIMRVRYEPVFVPVAPAMPLQAAAAPVDPNAPPVAAAPSQSPTEEAGEIGAAQAPTDVESAEPQEKVADENAKPEYVYWEDYRRGPGRSRNEWPWEAFRLRMSRDELVKAFGDEIGNKVPLDDIDSAKKGGDKDLNDNARTAEVWQIWDKDSRTVIFVNSQYAEMPLKVVPDPLQLDGFWCSAPPLYAIENTRTGIPVPLYRQYKRQARELNRTTKRINIITEALKVRGAYAANISELASIFKSGDNDMTPIQNVTEIAAAGGLDKAIWILPIEKLIVVLQGLYMARNEIKQTIYELTGISDIVRGSTNPNETKGAQVLKSQWGTLRLQRLQREVQRFARDVTRLISEVVSQMFSQQQLQAMTQVQLPTAQDKMQAQMALQQAQTPQIDPATGQAGPAQAPPPEAIEIVNKPTWDDVMALLKSDQMRCYKIDIETDSTVSETIDRDMQGLSEILQALGQFIQVVGPLVQQGIMPIAAAREIALTIVRRARLGSAVEDQIAQIGAEGQHMQQQNQQADQINQVLQAIQQLGQGMQQQGQDLGNGVQNGLQQLSVQLENAVQNVSKTNQQQMLSRVA